jgi:hypothetical protein
MHGPVVPCDAYNIALITDNLLTASSAFSILVLSFDCLSRRRSRPVAHTRPTLQSTGC